MFNYFDPVKCRDKKLRERRRINRANQAKQFDLKKGPWT